MTAIAIVGSRDFPNLEMVQKFVESLDDGTIIVTGGARGVDQAAEDAALPLGLFVQVIKPDWNRYGRGAGMIRNTQIVKASDKVVAFWDGESRGTMDTVKKARKVRKPVAIYGADGKMVDAAEPVVVQGSRFEEK